MENTCETCRFHKAYECRRFPPQVTLWASDNQHPIAYETITVYPSIGPNTPQCGEYKSTRDIKIEVYR